MVREILKLRTDNGLGESNPTFKDIEITEYSFTSPRMGMPSLTATLMWPTCLDDEWTDKEYVVLRGEKYYVRKTPTSEKSNTDTRYKHTLEFKSEREQLGHVYFYDVVPSWSSTHDRPNTNSTEFKLYATIREYTDRLNCAFRYAGIGDSILNTKTSLTDADTPVGDGYCVIVSGYGGADLSVSKEISFTDQWLWDALVEGYNKFEIPFSFRGKKIVFNEYVAVTDYIFKYGFDSSLLSVKKENANARIVNRITFKGSSENIPYYYPNKNEYGSTTLNIPSTNKVFTASTVAITDEARLISRMKEGEYAVVVSKGNALTVTEIGVPESFASSGDWFKMSTRDTVVRTTVTMTFSVDKADDYFLNSLQAQCWRPLQSQPSYRNNNMQLVEVMDVTSSYLVKDGTTTHVPLKQKNEGGYIELGHLETGTWTLYANVDINTHGVEDWFIRIYDSSIADYNRNETSGYYWQVGKQLYNSLLLFGITTTVSPNGLSVGDKISWSAGGRMPFQTNLVPPKYRNTNGAERFYNALNNTYPDGAGGFLYFPNPYVAGNPKEYIYVNEDIKPTIEGITNSVGQLLGQIAEIAFDSDDNDSLSAGTSEENDKNDALKYEHSFFYIKLHRFSGVNGFDLFKSASQTDAMTLQMTSGKCNGCKFKIQVITDDEVNEKDWRNPVQVKAADGDIVDGTYTDKVNPDNPQDFQQDTTKNEIWICVQKDASTFGVIMPNRSHNYLPEAGDTFNIINIDLPQGYITAAEKRGEDAMLRFMAENNEEKFNFGISASRIFFANNPELLAELDEYSRIRIEYNGKLYEQYVSTFGIECKNGEALPDVKIELTGTLSTSQGFIEEIVASIPSLLPSAGGYAGGGLSTALADARYIRRDIPDRIQYRLSTDNGFEVGRFISGIAGGLFGIDPVTGQTYLETDHLKVRMRAVFEELLISKVSSVQGKLLITPGGGVDITFVEETDTDYICYFKSKDDGKGADCSFEAGDMVICREFNVSAGLNINASNQYYWREVVSVDNTAGYVLLSKTKCLANSSVPQAGDTLVQLGNKTKKYRQTAIVISTVDDNSPSIDTYSNIDSYSLAGKRLVSLGCDSEGNVYFRLGKDGADKYLLYEQDSGLTVSGDISVKSTIGGENIDDYISGKAGTVSELYRIDLSNEVAPVACNASGTVTGSMPKCRVRVWKGSEDVTNSSTITLAGTGVSAQWDQASAGKTFMTYNLTADTATVIVTAKPKTDMTLEATMSIYKVKPGQTGADGKNPYFAYCSAITGTLPHPTSVTGFSLTAFDGAKYIGVCTTTATTAPTDHTAYEWSEYKGEDGIPGEDAIIYEIIPNVDQVLRDADGNLTPATINCSVYKIKGALRSLSNEKSLRYKMLPDDTAWKSLSRASGVSANITVTDSAQSIVFELYSGSTVYDRETVPVLTDASGFSGGENLLKGTNQGTNYWGSSIYGSAGTSGSGAGPITPNMLLSSMENLPRGVIATNRVSYPFGKNTQVNVPQSVTYQLEFSTDSYFELLAANKYMLGFDITVKGVGPMYIYVEAQRNGQSSWVTLTPWLYNGNIEHTENGTTVNERTLHIGTRLNTLTSDLKNVRCIRLSVVANQANEYITQYGAQVGKYHIDSIEVSNLKIEQGVIQTPWTPALRDTDYLTQAFRESTTISGGVVMTSRVRVGYTDKDGNWVETGGLNGIATDYSGTEVSTAPILYCGGGMIDAAESTADDRATSMIRLDGTAYFANNTVRMGYNAMNIGDNIVLDEDGLHLIDTNDSTEKLLVTNRSIGDLSEIQNKVSVPLALSTTKNPTMNFYRSTGTGSTTEIQPLAGFYLKSMSESIIKVNDGNPIGTGGMSLNANVSLENITLNGWQTNDNFEAYVSVILQVNYGSSGYMNWKTYPMNFKVVNGKAQSDVVNIVATLTQGNYYRIIIKCTKSAANNAVSNSVASTVTFSGAATSTMNKNVLGNDGFVSVWGNTVLMAKNEHIDCVVGQAFVSVDTHKAVFQFGEKNGVKVQTDGVWFYVPSTSNWKRLDIEKLWNQGFLLS